MGKDFLLTPVGGKDRVWNESYLIIPAITLGWRYREDPRLRRWLSKGIFAAVH